MTVKEYIDTGTERLLPLYPKKEARALLQMALESFCQYPDYIYYSDPDRPLPFAHLPDLQRALDDLCRHRPIQYIAGKTLFEGCTIHVREGVLIPRPETEELVRLAKSSLSDADSILDLCTGSGAIAVVLAKAFPQAKVYGVDILENALDVAKENSLFNKVEIHFYKADILNAPNFSELPFLPHSFDLIISNPPYVCNAEKAQMCHNVLLYEPHVALFVPDKDPLLFYRALADWGKALLKDGGRLMAEINEQMDHKVRELLKHKGYSSIEIHTDLNGKPRICSALSGKRD